ncbi:MAG: 3-oxoacyl-ACP synthase [Alteromonadaceae bacterium]|jgi:3-oxoacyl-[acyl-carrier-protein] synthase-3|uniref:Beta-ketoacyl-[acyl-carrier-protein] synthase III n=3 Tax=Rheinheimera TaxID=67575 RepID=A0ABN1DE65_9GAMM|nr:beta-ketoacyl-ACP synthase III [Rheinheimera aquimaris]MBJ91074.1 3-oxoacyl-ACP synthase [Alteromonadaceae bacterium]MCB5212213.1 ketoacyl-ACP synthase III [Rheinheimera aquimaris]MCD1599344.1 ketoacyl-ACP synthase III [Rheinheimera aquimaris]HBN89737.1 3-oxoacyl-ACP synthase [Rheinheimera sp.]|tara:strand:+ start:498 stop:1457 length:960 start_codon:yes stop_codon:yes gene_type:complete
MYSRIIGTGSYFPSQVRSNADLESMVETTDEWIIERTGIRERRIIGDDETVATMGAQAALKAFEAADIDKNSIDMIICATTSASRALPSAACEIQRELQMHAVPAFDIAAACAGFCYALSVADQYIKSGIAKRVLVIGSDCLSRLVSPEDRSMVILFGDAAGAVVLEASEQPGILSTHIQADGKYSELLYVDNPIRGNEASVHQSWGSMKGNDVFKVAVTKLSEVVEQTLAANNLDKSEIDWLVPHQANLRIISAVARKLDMSMDQVVINLDRYGNTSAATVPTALDEAVRDGRIQRGQTLLLEAFGGGFAWASALVRY